MLFDISNFRELSIAATDGEIGSVEDLYFDDESWTVRYVVVDTGTWLSGRKVLVSPISVRAIGWDKRTLAVELTRKQLESAPDVDTEKPVSRQYERRYFRYYGYPYYWTGPYLWGLAPYPASTPAREYELATRQQEVQASRDAEESDSHLRSAREVTGYHIVAPDGGLGHAASLLVDSTSWNIRALVVDTRNWLPGKHVLIPPDWVERVQSSDQSLYVTMSRETIRANPEYDRDAPVDEHLAERLMQLGRFGSRRNRAHAVGTA